MSFLARVGPKSFVHFAIVLEEGQTIRSSDLTPFKKISLTIPVSVGGLVSTSIGSPAGIGGEATVAMGQINCSLTCSVRRTSPRSSECINVQSNSLINSLMVGFHGPLFLIIRLSCSESLSSSSHSAIHHHSRSFPRFFGLLAS